VVEDSRVTVSRTSPEDFSAAYTKHHDVDAGMSHACGGPSDLQGGVELGTQGSFATLPT